MYCIYTYTIKGAGLVVCSPRPPTAQNISGTSKQFREQEDRHQRRASGQNALQNIPERTKYHTYEQTSPDNKHMKKRKKKRRGSVVYSIPSHGRISSFRQIESLSCVSYDPLLFVSGLSGSLSGESSLVQ